MRLFVNNSGNVPHNSGNILDYQRNLGNCYMHKSGNNYFQGSMWPVNVQNGFSFSLWFFRQSASASVVPFSLGAFGSGRIFVSLNVQSGFINWEGDPGYGRMDFSQANLLLNRWNMITFVLKSIDVADWEVYINGLKRPATVFSNNLREDSRLARHIRPGQGVSDSLYTASFMIFDRTLDTEAVSTLYNSNGVCPYSLKESLVQYYLFENKKGKFLLNHAPRTIGMYQLTGHGITDIETGIPDQSTNTRWRDAYTLQAIVS